MTYDASGRTTPELLADWAAVMRELRVRDVIRTNNNPVGDIAEGIVAAHYRGERGSFVQAGWDVKTPEGERTQVKAMRTTLATKRRNLSPIRDTDTTRWSWLSSTRTSGSLGRLEARARGC